MGWDMVNMHVFGHISRHNSDQDKVDDGLWEEFCTRIAVIAKEHRYNSLNLDVYGGQMEGF